MGGTGSGRRQIRKWRREVERAHAIRMNVIASLINDLAAKPDQPRAGGLGTWADGSTVALIVERGPEGYSLRILADISGAKFDRTIGMTSTASNLPQYQGRAARWWLCCPSCQRRCGVLALCYGEPLCRVCARLTYASNNRSRLPAWVAGWLGEQATDPLARQVLARLFNSRAK